MHVLQKSSMNIYVGLIHMEVAAWEVFVMAAFLMDISS